MKDDCMLNGIKRTACEIYSRIVGYLKPVDNWHESKQGEFENRSTLKVDYKEK